MLSKRIRMTESGEMEVDKAWDRSSADRDDDLLHTFLTGEMYDCTFKVGKTPETSKVFKCHKYMLSTVSSVFYAMLQGNFSESSKGPDDPINLKDVDADVFEAAMRFVYGKQASFRDTSHAIQVYLFANKMRISFLIGAVEDLLCKDMTSDNVLEVFELFSLTQSKAIGRCCEELQFNAQAALKSSSWLKATEDTVGAVLKSEKISIDEVDLFRALLSWGRAQVERDGGHDDEQESLLRAKVDPFLKHIRFETMDSKQAALICSSAKIFKLEEQRSILLASGLNDAKFLSPGLAVEQKRPARTSTFSANVTLRNENVVALFHAKETRFDFCVTRKVFLLGFKLLKRFPMYEVSLQDLKDFSVSTLKFVAEKDKKSYRVDGNNAQCLLPGKTYTLRDETPYDMKIRGGADASQPRKGLRPSGEITMYSVVSTDIPKLLVLKDTQTFFPIAEIIFKPAE